MFDKFLSLFGFWVVFAEGVFLDDLFGFGKDVFVLDDVELHS